MPLNPLNQDLQKTRYGYQLDEHTKVNTLFYVDDLKLYGANYNLLKGLVNTIKIVSDDIKMEFGLDKCVKATFRRDKKIVAEGIPLKDKSESRPRPS